MMLMELSGQKFYDRKFTLAWGLSLLAWLSMGMAVFQAVRAFSDAGSDRTESVIVLGVMLLLVLVLGLLLGLRVVVTDQDIVLIWGVAGVLKSRFELGKIEKYQVVTFRPLEDFGGWGWRRSRKGIRCYNMRGKSGVELTIDGSGYIVGVDDPEELARAIEIATGRKPEPPRDSL